jgi:tRNA-splicing ligase RtcB
MPDCHQGYGMPIGGVIACEKAVIPNAVGVDIGCGMRAVQTDIEVGSLTERVIRKILHAVRSQVPLGEGHAHSQPAEEWVPLAGVERTRPWMDPRGLRHDRCNLGTLGGGNHFIELQAGNDGVAWLMIHTGSRNLGYRVADYYHKTALRECTERQQSLSDPDLAYLEAASETGRCYIRDMQLALDYARENRLRIMTAFRRAVSDEIPSVTFTRMIDIHHNYAAFEEHLGHRVWVHRKGATAARRDEWGIIPGSMGTASYIVQGRGNPDSFMSCSHGAGRRMGRMQASRTLSETACSRAMEGIVFDGWSRFRGRGKRRKMKGMLDLSEAPQAYKDIDEVIAAQDDLIRIRVRLCPLGVLKG